MPVEIREMVVKATVNATSEKETKGGCGKTENSETTPPSNQSLFKGVAEMMNRKKER